MSDLKQTTIQDDMRGFLHRHPMTEMNLALDSNHCIVDMRDWEIARRQANGVQIRTERASHIQNVSDSLSVLNEALSFIQQANDEYKTYYSRIDGKVKNVNELANNLAKVIENYRMEEGLKLYRVEFEGVWPVGNCLVLVAFNQEQAEEMAKKTITHTDEMVVNEITINEPQIIGYLSGDY